MIQELEIHNFKSIKDLTLPCKRFNIFIGEPNTGKSNILEALGLVSFVETQRLYEGAELQGFVRHVRMPNLFYDQNLDESLSISCDKNSLELTFHNPTYQCVFTDPDRVLLAKIEGTDLDTGHISSSVVEGPAVRFYRAPAVAGFSETTSDYLLPPYGTNLLSLLSKRRDLAGIVGLFFSSLGYRLWLRPHENQIDIAKASEDIVITSFPYSLASDTLQRITFYTAAIETNKNAVIVLEEPEAHSFPGETKLLAEQIAMDEYDNQYFVVTHNPYFLMPLLSKAPKDDIAINIVYTEDDYQTKVKGLKPEDLPELFELDIFANLSRYIED